jgi:hypothetical protein
MFICDICNSEYKTKRSLDIHMNRKNKCNVTSPYKCSKCNKYFKYKKNLQEHTIKQICIENKDFIVSTELSNSLELNTILNSAINKEKKIDLINTITNIPNIKISTILDMEVSISEQIQLLNKIETVLNNSKSQSSISNSTINSGTIENSNNIINNIQINNFGKEDIAYLDNSYFKNLIMTQHIENGYVQLIKDIYLNKEHPENGTIKVENLNNKYAHVYNNGKWDTILKYDLREQLHKKNYTILKMHYNKLKKSMSPPKKEETVTFLARDELSDPHMMYVIDKIILLFYNEGEGDDTTLDKHKLGKNIV